MTVRAASLALLFALHAALCVAAPAAGNLLDNPGFEEGEGGRPAWWVSGAWKSKEAVHERTRAKKTGGKYSFHLSKKTPGGVQLISRTITLPADRLRSARLVLSGSYIATGKQASVQLRFYRQDKGGKPVAMMNGLGGYMKAGIRLKPSPKWSSFRQALRIPRDVLANDTLLMRLYFLAKGNDIYLDELRLELEPVAARAVAADKTTRLYGDFSNIVLHQPELTAEEKSWYGPFPRLPFKIECRDGIVYRGGKPFFLFGTNTLAGSQWSAASNWVPRVLKHDYVDIMSSASRILTTRVGEKGKLHIEWRDASWTRSLLAELARMGVATWHDVGTCKYRYVRALTRYEERFPELKKVLRPGSHFYPFDHNNPFGRDLYATMWQAYYRYYPDAPALGFEVFNELGYRPDFPATLEAFREASLRKYGSLATANRVWRTSFKTRADVLPPHLWDDSLAGFEQRAYLKQQRERYWQMYADWLAFLRVHFAKGFRQLKKRHDALTRNPFTLDSRYEQNANDGYTATDPELNAEVADVLAFHVTGWRFFNYGGRPAEPACVMESLTRPVQYLDYMRTAVKKTIISSECIFRYAVQPGTEEQTMVGNCLAKLHKTWKFRTDPADVGVKEGWFREKHNDATWGDIEVPGLWEAKNPAYKDYDGVAWYRTTFVMPGWCKAGYADGSRRYLLVGRGLDDAGDIYVNGRKILSISGWNTKYVKDISEHLHYGAGNSIAVRVNDTRLGGGIRFAIALIRDDMLSRRKELNRAQLSALFWSHTVHGASGVTAWYWLDPMQTWLPELRAAINSVAEVLLPRPRIRGKVAVLFPLEAFRGFFTTRDPGAQDIMEYMGALTFHQVPTDVLSSRVFLRMKNDRYPLVVAPYAKVVRDGSFAKLQSYLQSGGAAVLTYDSFSMSDRRYEPLPLPRLLGVAFGKDVTGKEQVSYKGATFPVSTGDYTKKQGLRLVNRSAQILGRYGDGSPAIVARDVGKGRVYFVAAEIGFRAIHRLLGDIMKERGITSPVEVASSNKAEFPYVEAQVIGGRERFLLYLVNWGGQPHPLTVRVHAPYAVSGAYVMRDVQDRAWPRQGRTVSAKTLNAGLRLDLPVQMPKVLLFESAASGRRLKLRRISPKRKAVLARIEAMKRNPLPSDRPKALFVADRKGERRTELLGKIVHPLAVQVLEREGYDVHWLDYRDLTPERLKTFALFVLVEDSKLKISVLHRNREFRRRVRAYVREGGSLLLAGSGSVHYNANNRFIRYLLTQPYKIKAVSFCKNPKSCGFGDPLQLTVRTFAKHPLTEHVKALQFFVCAGLSGTSPGFTPVAFAEKSDLNHPGAPLVLAGEVGDGGRMVVATDNTWMQPFRIEEADNAQFLVNTIRWLGRKPVKRIHKPSFIASLFITEKLMREIEKEEQ